jgi:predicted transcriptional regulator
MTTTTVETTEIEITDSTIELSETQTQYINHGIAKGFADIKAGRYLSDPDEIDADIQRKYELKKQAYLDNLK